jgi:hypothetical protein
MSLLIVFKSDGTKVPVQLRPGQVDKSETVPLNVERVEADATSVIATTPEEAGHAVPFTVTLVTVPTQSNPGFASNAEIAESQAEQQV